VIKNRDIANPAKASIELAISSRGKLSFVLDMVNHTKEEDAAQCIKVLNNMKTMPK
jgi:hypothetical protein